MSSKTPDLRIAISGKSGCGNTTVSRLVARKLGLRHINYTFHDMAEEQCVSFRKMCQMAEEDNKWDLQLDKKQIELAMKGSCVLGSRLAIWLLKHADYKVFLDGSIEVRAQRIHEREGGNYEEVLEETITRDKNDHNRYMRLYNINNFEFDFADLIINTEKYDQYEVRDFIIENVQKSRANRNP